MKKALIIIDLQNDFMPTGSLPVPKADEVIAVANQLQKEFEVIVATQDWHPADHDSFASNHANHKHGDIIDLYGIQQILWPDHCVQNTKGADFVVDLDISRAHIIHKGSDRTIDSYSAFFDNGHRKDTGLHQYLQSQQIDTLYIMGVATDYCVKYTVLDACHLGYHTHVITEGCRGVNLNPDDTQKAFSDMQAAGAILL